MKCHKILKPFCPPRDRGFVDYLREWIKDVQPTIEEQQRIISEIIQILHEIKLEVNYTKLEEVYNLFDALKIIIEQGGAVDFIKLSKIIEKFVFDDTTNDVIGNHIPISELTSGESPKGIVVVGDGGYAVDGISFNGDSGKVLLGDGTWGDLVTARTFFVELTYSELKDLRDNGQLVAGAIYRLTNYEATCNTDRGLPDNLFHIDIYLLAKDANSLFEEVKLICNGHNWKGKYCLDNDNSRFDWAADTGFGVIFELIDHNNNKANFDWYNIKPKVDYFKGRGLRYDDIEYLYTNSPTDYVWTAVNGVKIWCKPTYKNIVNLGLLSDALTKVQIRNNTFISGRNTNKKYFLPNTCVDYFNDKTSSGDPISPSSMNNLKFCDNYIVDDCCIMLNLKSKFVEFNNNKILSSTSNRNDGLGKLILEACVFCNNTIKGRGHIIKDTYFCDNDISCDGFERYVYKLWENITFYDNNKIIENVYKYGCILNKVNGASIIISSRAFMYNNVVYSSYTKNMIIGSNNSDTDSYCAYLDMQGLFYETVFAPSKIGHVTIFPDGELTLSNSGLEILHVICGDRVTLSTNVSNKIYINNYDFVNS